MLRSDTFLHLFVTIFYAIVYNPAITSCPENLLVYYENKRGSLALISQKMIIRPFTDHSTTCAPNNTTKKRKKYTSIEVKVLKRYYLYNMIIITGALKCWSYFAV